MALRCHVLLACFILDRFDHIPEARLVRPLQCHRGAVGVRDTLLRNSDCALAGDPLCPQSACCEAQRKVRTSVAWLSRFHDL